MSQRFTMHPSPRRTLSLCAIFLSCATRATAQSFNVDVGPPGFGPPSPTWPGAAGQAGVWGVRDADLASQTLFDLTGAPTSVVLAHNGGTGNFGSLAWPATTDFDLLVRGVALGIPVFGFSPPDPTPFRIEWTFSNLSNGSYRVYTYGVSNYSGAETTGVRVVGSIDPDRVVESSGYTLATSFAMHRVIVTQGSLTVKISTPWPGPGPVTNQSNLDGFQLVREGPVPDFFPLCFAAQTPCPCGNAGFGGSGCRNSSAFSGAQLVGSGTPSVSNDSFVLVGSSMPVGSTCLYFQGTVLTAPQSFGDGLRCAGGSLMRLAIKPNPGSASSFPEAGDPSIAAAGVVSAAGGPLVYQVWYRDTSGPCGTGSNLTNAVQANWLP